MSVPEVKDMEIICLCGSVKFRDTFLKVKAELEKQNCWVLLPENMETDIQVVDDRVKMLMDYLHLQKILLSSRVLVINVNGYIGESTQKEITFATKYGFPVTYLETLE